MSELDKIFKKEIKDYKITFNPIKDYFDFSSSFLKVMGDAKFTKEDIKDYIKQTKQFKNPSVYFYERDADGNKSKQITKLTDYISYITAEDKIIAPSFTVYFNPSEKRSLHAAFIEANVKKRAIHKKEAFKQKMLLNFEKFSYHNTLQKSMKIFNNSLSGAYASAGTVLNNPSAHYTLTSITRCLSGIGNTISESIIAGNKHFKDPNTTLNYLVTVANDAPIERVKQVLLDFKIKIPTPEEAMEAVLKSSRKYWRDTSKELVIFKYLKNVDGFTRAFIVYHNDLYHMRELNRDFMFNMITEMLEYGLIDIDESSVDDAMGDIKDWVYNFVMHILSERLKGKKKDDFTLEDKRHIISIAVKLNTTFLKYKELFNVFFVTNVFPVSISTVKDMVRETIVLSDTDSTCATYSEWVHWYFDRPDYSPKSIGITAAVMTIVTQVVDHYIKLLGVNMNIKYEDTMPMEMKNEFFWKVFVNTNVSKHYFADIFIQEGNIYDLDKKKTLEKKGVHLIAPNAYKPIRDLAEELMIKSMETTYAGEKIEISYYINKILEAEELIRTKLKEGSPDVLKLEKIKEAKSYKNEPKDSPFLHHLLWEEVFEEFYGKAPDPTYMAIKLPTVINTKAEMKEALKIMNNESLSNKFDNFLKKYGKDAIKTFRLPLVIVYNNGIPNELLPLLNEKRVILDNCKVLYIVLESLGFYVKDGLTLSEMLK